MTTMTMRIVLTNWGQRSESIVTEAIFSKDVRFKELPREEERFPPPFTKQPYNYNLVKGQMGEFVEIKFGFTYNPKEKLYCSPSGQKYRYDGSSFIRQNNSEDMNATVMDETIISSEDQNGLKEERAPIRVSMSLSLSSSAKAQKLRDGGGFVSANPLGPKVHRQETLEGEHKQNQEQELLLEGPSEFESFFQGEGRGQEEQLPPPPSLSSFAPALTSTSSSIPYVEPCSGQET